MPDRSGDAAASRAAARVLREAGHRIGGAADSSLDTLLRWARSKASAPRRSCCWRIASKGRILVIGDFDAGRRDQHAVMARVP